MIKNIVPRIRIDVDPPGQACAESGKPDLDRLPVGIDGHVDDIITDSPLFMSRKEDPQYLVRPADHVVIGVRAAGDTVRKSAVGGLKRPADDGVLFAEGDHVPVKIEEVLVEAQIIPVEPGDLIVLTVAVVIAVLGIPEFIPRIDHGSPPAAHQDCDGIAHHFKAEGPDHGIVRRTLDPAVPAAVVISAVHIVPAVCFVVFVVVGKQVVKREAVVAGDEIDGGAETVITVLIQVGRTHDPVRGLLRVPEIALEIVAERISVAAVPLRPPAIGREAADLVHAARVPGLRDELGLRKDRVLRDSPEQGRIPDRDTLSVPAQDTGQIKTEAVDMILRHPVAETVHDIADHDRMVAVKGIAASAEIVVLPSRREHVVDTVVNALETHKGPVLVSLRGVVKDDVQIDLDLVVLEQLDELLELGSFLIVLQ